MTIEQIARFLDTHPDYSPLLHSIPGEDVVRVAGMYTLGGEVLSMTEVAVMSGLCSPGATRRRPRSL
jgi:hypothetical protein